MPLPILGCIKFVSLFFIKAVSLLHSAISVSCVGIFRCSCRSWWIGSSYFEILTACVFFFQGAKCSNISDSVTRMRIVMNFNFFTTGFVFILFLLYFFTLGFLKVARVKDTSSSLNCSL